MSDLKEVTASDLKKVVEQYPIIFVDNGDINYTALYNLWTNNELFNTDNSSGSELCLVGLYYQYVTKDYVQMKRYFLMGIEKCDHNAMHNLGYYYENVEKDYSQMKRYYLMAIELGYSMSMLNLGNYYQYTEKNPELMKRYYLMGIERGDSTAMVELGRYYNYPEKNPELMKRYLLMAMENGNLAPIHCLSAHYAINFNSEYSEALPYFYKYLPIKKWVEAVNLIYFRNLDITPELIDHLTNVKDEHLEMLPKFVQWAVKTVKEKIDILEVHFKYAPGAEGYEECKNDFYNSISNS